MLWDRVPGMLVCDAATSIEILGCEVEGETVWSVNFCLSPFQMCVVSFIRTLLFFKIKF